MNISYLFYRCTHRARRGRRRRRHIYLHCLHLLWCLTKYIFDKRMGKEDFLIYEDVKDGQILKNVNFNSFFTESFSQNIFTRFEIQNSKMCCCRCLASFNPFFFPCISQTVSLESSSMCYFRTLKVLQLISRNNKFSFAIPSSPHSSCCCFSFSSFQMSSFHCSSTNTCAVLGAQAQAGLMKFKFEEILCWLLSKMWWRRRRKRSIFLRNSSVHVSMMLIV